VRVQNHAASCCGTDPAVPPPPASLSARRGVNSQRLPRPRRTRDASCGGFMAWGGRCPQRLFAVSAWSSRERAISSLLSAL
jgi:hypothetical protein